MYSASEATISQAKQSCKFFKSHFSIRGSNGVKRLKTTMFGRSALGKADLTSFREEI